jgi:hypothetical protein
MSEWLKAMVCKRIVENLTTAARFMRSDRLLLATPLLFGGGIAALGIYLLNIR